MLYNKGKAWKFDGIAVYTNTPPAGALRGFGVTQGTFALECAVNELAAELGLDPVAVRELNMIRPGEVHPLYPKTQRDVPGPIVMDSCRLDWCVEEGRRLFDWERRKARPQASERRVRGVGMALGQQGSGLPNIDMANVLLTLSDDGFFTLMTGSTDIGTGSDTILAQIAAEALEVAPETVVVVSGDTDVTGFDTGAYASSTTYTTGNAVIEACKAMRTELIKSAAQLFGVAEETVSYREGGAFSEAGGQMSLKELGRTLTYDRGFRQLSVSGSYVPKKPAPPYVAGFVEVEVDLATGAVAVVEALEVIDCGTPINPKLARVQAEGGMVQGIGLALQEDVRMLPNGRLETDRFTTYKLPARRDLGTLRVAFAPGYDETGPYGAKSIGEVVVNPMAPAIVAAVHDACGVWIRELPITPEKVLEALRK